ncbi:MAG: hypothetical protein GY790_05785 [Bacteroidetes bacterium]|nr:hypothetical protein [Bacteroidota bacterium]
MRKIQLVILSLIILLPSLEAQDHYRTKKHTGLSTGLQEAIAVPWYRMEDTSLVFIRQKLNDGISAPRTSGGEPLFSIYQYSRREGSSDSWETKPLSDLLDSKMHDGPVSFTGDGKTMVYSQQRSSGESVDPVGIYFMDMENGQGVNPRAFPYNTDQSWLTSPAISPDGLTLIFSANLPGGEGGFDLYCSRLKGDQWTEPENMGPGVNTAGHEFNPFIHQSGMICFSSNGYDRGVFGFDLFETTDIGGKWPNAEKLPSPFSRRQNDYHVWFSPDLRDGYLTSDRQGGSKDIFTFTADIPDFGEPAPIKKNYFKYRIYDRKLDTVDPNLFRYTWVINDTLELPGHEVIYRFPGPGKYICRLNVYDVLLDTLVEGQTVKTLPIKLKEQVVIICQDTVRAYQPVDFDASQSHLPGFEVGRFVWSFGDGKFDESKQNKRSKQFEPVQHTFKYGGTFTVILAAESKPKNKRDTNLEVRSGYRQIVVIE